MVYISHLDLIRLFHRAARRADLPIALTQGFNPRFRLKLERALKLGVASDCEHGEMVLTEARDASSVKKDFQAVLPEGIEIKDVTHLSNI